VRVAIDTSALIKPYIAIQGGEELAAVLAAATSLHIAPHCRVEMHSAFNRLRLTKQMSAAACRAALAEFEQDLLDLLVTSWSAEIENEAIKMLPNSNLRAMAALHVAAALAVGAEQFITSDETEAQGSKQLGIATVFVA
jgi:predicted nucleic acid-binding protein